jgi:RecA-family ATPase
LVGLSEQEDTDIVRIEDGRVVATPLMDWLADEVAKIKAILLVLDASAGVHGNINEIVRREVRDFIALLRRRFVHALGCAVALIIHPSVDGLKSGRGTSGSTHWRNSARAVGLLEENGDDSETRIFRWPKINNGPQGLKFVLRWSNGLFLIDNPNSAAAKAARDKHIAIFRDLFNSYIKDNDQPLSNSSNARDNYAPKELLRLAEARGVEIKLSDLTDAMQDLMLVTKDQELRVDVSGPESRRIRKLVWAPHKGN